MHCSADDLFVIDGSCLVQASYDSFVGAPLLAADGKDLTFTYGVTRDFLRLRQSLGASRLALIFGMETYASAQDPELVNCAATFLEKMGVLVVNASACPVVDVSLTFLGTASYFVSSNPNLLQLTQHGPGVVLVRVRREFTTYDATRVRAEFGVEPKRIPDFLVLTQGPKHLIITSAQAVRLLERFSGGLEEVLQSLDTIKPQLTLRRIKDNDTRLREELARLMPRGRAPTLPTNSECKCDLDTPQNRAILSAVKFHSLIRMLPTPDPIWMKPSADEVRKSAYRAVVNSVDLAALVAAVRSTSVCAIDTESTGKDPRRAELLGMSLCLREGEAFYVPVTAGDLRGIGPAQVLLALKEIGECGTAFVGQNLKYDYVLLRCHGVDLSNCGFDTMLAAHECFRDWEFFNLNQLAQRLLKRKIEKYKDVIKGGLSLLDVPFSRLVHYACEDAETAFRLFNVLQDELQTHRVQAQFQLETMPLALTLGRWEYEGVAVNTEKLQALRQEAMVRVARCQESIHCYSGKSFDVDSEQEVRIVLSEDSRIGEFFRGERPTSIVLEGLSGNSEVARLFVQYRREKDVLRRIEDVLEQSHDGRVYPVFNQISSRYGQVTSRRPDILGTNILRHVVSESVAALYSDHRRSLKELVSRSRDHVLSEDIENGYPHDLSCFNTNPNEFLLSLAIGMSDTNLARKFLIELSMVSDLKHRMRMRYRRAFEWLGTYRADAFRLGFAQIGDRRFCAAGLRSSDLHKRQQAQNLCVRWILRH